jgi:ATP-dependent Clp protease, protease subunit
LRSTCTIDPLITVRKAKDLVVPPVVIRVNKFTEDSAKKFVESMEEAHNTGQPVIPIVIDSYGGAVYALLTMIDCIKSSKLPVATIVEGKAMSCGAVLLSYGTEGMRFAAPNSTVMIHDVAGMSIGKIEEVKANAEQMEVLNQKLFRGIAVNCGHDEEYFLQKIHEKGHAEWYLSAEQAKEQNLVQHIRIPTLDLQVQAAYTFK